MSEIDRGFLHCDRQVIEDGWLAFNLGSDARLMGLDRWNNPYLSDSHMGRKWKEGWESIHYGWGVEVKGRWRYKLLPLLGRA